MDPANHHNGRDCTIGSHRLPPTLATFTATAATAAATAATRPATTRNAKRHHRTTAPPLAAGYLSKPISHRQSSPVPTQ
ncbi:hypothetical protein GCM10022251_33590 [Phytohabitans flavus]